MLIFREPEPSDYALVADSFWRGVRECPSVFGLPRALVHQMLHDVIVKADWKVTILCDDNEPDEIMCWAVWQSATRIFWISVKPRYEGCGFARKMLDYMGVDWSGRGTMISCPILPPAIVARASKHHGLRLVARPYMTMV